MHQRCPLEIDDEIRAPVRQLGIFEQSLVPVPSEGQALLGEAHLRGPIILVWDAVRRGRHPERGHALAMAATAAVGKIFGVSVN